LVIRIECTRGQQTGKHSKISPDPNPWGASSWAMGIFPRRCADRDDDRLVRDTEITQRRQAVPEEKLRKNLHPDKGCFG